MPTSEHDIKSMYIELLKGALTASLYDESAWNIVEGERVEKYRSPINSFQYLKAVGRQQVVSFLKKRSVRLVHTRPYVDEVRLDGADWPMFGYSMVGHRRLDNTQYCIEDILRNNVPGDLIEAGVWRGGASIFMRALLKLEGVEDRRVWVADSFAGMPKPKSKSDGGDFSHSDYMNVSLEQVRANFARFGLLDSGVHFLKGWFEDTLPDAPISQLAVLRLDADLYHSTMVALKHLYDRVSPGGYVIVDDYGTWPACRRAVQDFLGARDLRPKILEIDHTGVFWQIT